MFKHSTLKFEGVIKMQCSEFNQGVCESEVTKSQQLSNLIFKEVSKVNNELQENEKMEKKD